MQKQKSIHIYIGLCVLILPLLFWSQECACETYLRNEKLGDAFWQPPLLTWQYHLQHVAMELFHDNKDTLWCLKHALKVDDAGMVEVLHKTNVTSVLTSILIITIPKLSIL